MKDKVIHFRTDTTTYNLVNTLAMENGLKMSEFMNAMLLDYIKKEAYGKKQIRLMLQEYREAKTCINKLLELVK